jgi:cyanophycinase-like exopeptidase
MARPHHWGGAPAQGVLTVIGSGETGPTVAPVYRWLRERTGTVTPALLLDTPYAFQENVADITAKLRRYFRGQLGAEPGVVTRAELTGAAVEPSAARIYGANWLFAGPGSPSYAMRYWSARPVQAAMAGVVRRGGCVTFASAAACTLGVSTLPVYEIYRVGADPYWLEGMDLMALAGLRVAVVPHFDNREGGRTHDTSHCYIGERRLRMLEGRLPGGTAVLGVDEHTAAVLDLAADTLAVVGRGGVTLRRGSSERRWETGAEVPLQELRAPALDGGRVQVVPPPPERRDGGDQPARPGEPFADLHRLSEAFERALVTGDVPAMVATVMRSARLGASPPAAAAEQANLALGGMVARLGELAVVGLRDPAELLEPLVGPLVSLRTELREAGNYQVADAVREVLSQAGVEVRDTPDGPAWRLAPAGRS